MSAGYSLHSPKGGFAADILMNRRYSRSVLLGLIGRGIGSSKSPMLHEREASWHGIQLVYRLIDFQQLGFGAEDLPGILNGARDLGFDGFNVTHPYKSEIIPLLSSLSADAAAIGAVNTVVVHEGLCSGFNTDWTGFMQSMRHGLPDAVLEHVALIGAGGAGAAAAYAMLRLGVRQLSVFDTDSVHAHALSEKLSAQFPDQSVIAVSDAGDAIGNADGVIQATPVGMSGHPGVPFELRLLKKHMWLADLVYAPPETELLAHARRIGCRVINGSGMLCFQAAEAFRIFTGVQPDAARMLRSLD